MLGFSIKNVERRDRGWSKNFIHQNVSYEWVVRNEGRLRKIYLDLLSLYEFISEYQ